MPEDLSIRVRNELYKKKMKHKQLAEVMGISNAYLSDLLGGRRTGPKAQERIKQIQKILNI